MECQPSTSITSAGVLSRNNNSVAKTQPAEQCPPIIQPGANVSRLTEIRWHCENQSEWNQGAYVHR